MANFSSDRHPPTRFHSPHISVIDLPYSRAGACQFALFSLWIRTFRSSRTSRSQEDEDQEAPEARRCGADGILLLLRRGDAMRARVRLSIGVRVATRNAEALLLVPVRTWPAVSRATTRATSIGSAPGSFFRRPAASPSCRTRQMPPNSRLPFARVDRIARTSIIGEAQTLPRHAHRS